ncbi:hypothetical protein LAD54_27430 [Klebsiella pneumoniae]|nr:hypothetical protein [Klebsiella pneumoniae]
MSQQELAFGRMVWMIAAAASCITCADLNSAAMSQHYDLGAQSRTNE